MILPQAFGKYWILQGLVIGVVVSYAVGMSIGIVLFMNNTQANQEQVENVSILLIIESHHPTNSFNYSYRSIILVNQTLIEYLNNTIGRENWDGKYFGAMGWFIQRIFNATEGGGWYWLYYYRVPGKKNWNSAMAGVSLFKLNQDYEIKFIFDKN